MGKAFIGNPWKKFSAVPPVSIDVYKRQLLTCTETVTAKHWWMRPFVPGYLKRQQKLYLCDLRKELLK